MLALLLAAPIAIAPLAEAPAVDCRFDSARMEFTGTPVEQARCLLRHVEPGGAAAREQDLPPALAARIGQPAPIDTAKLAAVLRHRHLPLPATTPVSETIDHHRALYFVIHDTSSP